MNSDNTITIVNLAMTFGILVALIFGSWVGKLNRTLSQQNEREREQLALAERLDEQDPKSE